MNNHPEQPDQNPRAELAGSIGGELFGWRGAGVVLFGEHVGQRWVLSRGYLGGDRLTDIRRWEFETPARLIRQVRRLTTDATGDTDRANRATSAAKSWSDAAAARCPHAHCCPPASS